jgi:transposase
MYCADVGALTASKLTNLNKNTTHRLYGLLRARVVEMAEGEAAPFTGSVEVDESYFGPRRVRGRRGRGSGRKVAVIGLLKRRGKVFCSPVMNCSKAELIEVIRGQVLPRKSTIYTDGWRTYDVGDEDPGFVAAPRHPLDVTKRLGTCFSQISRPHRPKLWRAQDEFAFSLSSF